MYCKCVIQAKPVLIPSGQEYEVALEGRCCSEVYTISMVLQVCHSNGAPGKSNDASVACLGSYLATHHAARHPARISRGSLTYALRPVLDSHSGLSSKRLSSGELVTSFEGFG
jgi:hypothetical protein